MKINLQPNFDLDEIVLSYCIPVIIREIYSALLWQKEATDKSPKSEKVMFLDWT